MSNLHNKEIHENNGLLIRELPADLETPVSAFLKIKSESGIKAKFLLESVEGGSTSGGIGRYSFIGVAPRAMFTVAHGNKNLKTRKVIIEKREGHREERALGDDDPLDLLKQEIAPHAIEKPNGLPTLMGGAVGFFNYDYARALEDRLNQSYNIHNGPPMPLCKFFLVDTLVIFDHLQRKLKIVARGDDRREQVDEIEASLNNPLPAEILSKRKGSNENEVSVSELPIYSNFSEKDFCESVEKAREYISSGDIYQVVLSQLFQGETTVPPFQIYRALRLLNPSPYMFYLDYGDIQIVGSSPETLVKLEGNTAIVRPIAGTRPRGIDINEDSALEKELLNNEKERAEHIMLLDLGRNDLGRVCEYGTVRVQEMMNVDRYSHVMHLTSHVVGTLSSNRDQFDLLRATFPAGTVSGAPKVRAMEIIEELERSRRGVYAGGVGYFSVTGDMDICIAIRTIIIKDQTLFLQGGAGIVYDSIPEKEYEECLLKVEALKQAILLAEKL
jgi:anthranilate synthase component 1